LRRAAPGLRLNEHFDHEDGGTVFRHACKMGLEGIVSKRKDSPYRSGRTRELVCAELATATAQRVTAGGKTMEAATLRITAAGRRAC
jgi:hypothetical protein